MANYFVIGNTFKPYSFDELIKPYQIYGQAYKEQEATMEALADQAGTLDSLQYSPNDSNEYKTYLAYKDMVNNASTALGTSGLTPESRKAVSDAAKYYRTVISPIQQSVAKREELDKEWRQKHGADTTWIGNRPSNLSLKEIQSGNYSNLYGVSGADIEKEATTAAAAASARLYSEKDPKLAMWNQYIRTEMAQGFDEERASKILNDLENSEEFGKDIQVIKESSGYNKMTPYEKEQFKGYLFRGFFNGIGYKPDIDYHKNTDLDRALTAEKLKKERDTKDDSNVRYPSEVPYKPYFDASVTSKDREAYEALYAALSDIEGAANAGILDKETDINTVLPALYGLQYGSTTTGNPTMAPSKTKYTYGEILEKVSRDFGIPIDITYDQNGKITYLSGTQEAKNQLANLIDNAVKLSKGLIYTTVEDNKNAVDHLNFMTAGAEHLSLIQKSNGKGVSGKFSFDTNTPSYIKFTPSGDLEVKQGGDKYIVSPEAISASPTVEVISYLKNGNGDFTASSSGSGEDIYQTVRRALTPLEAQQRYKDIIRQLKSARLAPEEREALMNEANNLSAGIMDSLYGESNSYGRAQSKTLPTNAQ